MIEHVHSYRAVITTHLEQEKNLSAINEKNRLIVNKKIDKKEYIF